MKNVPLRAVSKWSLSKKGENYRFLGFFQNWIAKAWKT